MDSFWQYSVALLIRAEREKTAMLCSFDKRPIEVFSDHSVYCIYDVPSNTHTVVVGWSEVLEQLLNAPVPVPIPVPIPVPVPKLWVFSASLNSLMLSTRCWDACYVAVWRNPPSWTVSVVRDLTLVP